MLRQSESCGANKSSNRILAMLELGSVIIAQSVVVRWYYGYWLFYAMEGARFLEISRKLALEETSITVSSLKPYDRRLSIDLALEGR